MFTDLKTKLRINSSFIRSVKDNRNQNGITTPIPTPTLLSRASNANTYNSYSSESSTSSNNSIPKTPTTAPNINNKGEMFLNHTHLKPGIDAELLDYEKTINLYRENAKAINDPKILWDLATYLYEAYQQSSNNAFYLQEAFKILKSLSFKGHTEAQYYLANIYASGQLSTTQKAQFGHAFPLYLQAAKRQHSEASYRAAKCYEDGLGCLKNKTKAAQYYRLAAALSHPGAMYRLGLAEIRGELDFKINIRNGNKWLKRSVNAATVDYPHAIHELGLMHETGLSDVIFKDISYSIQLYTKAAELSYAPSAYRLGQCFEYGYLGCPKNAVYSVYYYTIAARQDHPEACFALSAWYLVGGNNFEASEEKALMWAKVSAEKGFDKAEYALGYFSEEGIGKEKNMGEARMWYEKAAEHGNKKAIEKLESRGIGCA